MFSVFPDPSGKAENMEKVENLLMGGTVATNDTNDVLTETPFANVIRF